MLGVWGIRWMQVCAPHLRMMCCRVMLGVRVCKVEGSRSPVNEELALPGAILQPVKTHVNGLGPFLLDGSIGKTHGSCVVNLNGRGGLWVSHLSKSGAEGNSFLGIDVGGPDFSFSCRAHDVAHDLGDAVDGSIEHGRDSGASCGLLGALLRV